MFEMMTELFMEANADDEFFNDDEDFIDYIESNVRQECITET